MTDQTYSIGAGNRGLWLGLGPSRVGILAAAMLGAAVLAYTGAPLPIAALAAFAGAGWCLLSVGGVSLHEWAGTASSYLCSVVTSSRVQRAEIATCPATERVTVGRALRLRPSRELGRLLLMPILVDGIELGVIAERGRAGWDVTCLFATRGQAGFALAEHAEQARLIGCWAELLMALTGEYAGRCRLQWIDQAAPHRADQLRAWHHDLGASTTHPYRGLLDSAEDQSIRHTTLLAVQLATGARDREHAVRDAEAVYRLVAARLANAEIVPHPLDVAGVARQLRLASESTFPDALFSDGVDAERILPASRRATWDHLRTDDALHRTFLVTGWPRIPVGPSWLAPLLVSAPPGAVRTVAMHFAAIPPPVAARRARAARQGADLDSEDRVRLGFGIGARERGAQLAAAATEQELAAGHVQHRVAAVVMVSAPDLAALDEASRQVRASAASARLDLRALHGRHADGWAAALPLCRLRHRAPA